MEKVHSKVESENVCSMQIIQELPINKPNFPFKHTQDFYRITHIASYIDLWSSLIISVSNYFYYVSKLMEMVTS